MYLEVSQQTGPQGKLHNFAIIVEDFRDCLLVEAKATSVRVGCCDGKYESGVRFYLGIKRAAASSYSAFARLI